MDNFIFVTAGLAGAGIFAAGILMRVYPVKTEIFRDGKGFSSDAVINSRLFNNIWKRLSGNESSFLYRYGRAILKKANVDLDVRKLYFYKLNSLFLITLLIISVKFTNVNILKDSIISRAAQQVNVFESVETVNYRYNASLYRAVLERIGEKNLERIDEGKRLDAIKAALERQLHGVSSEAVEREARAILKTFNSLRNIRLFDIKILMFIFSAFFIPELILLAKGLLHGSRYRKEVLKLESIFELLGGINGFKTIFILKEMSNSSNVLRKQLKSCIVLFQSDRERALERLRTSIQNNRFSKLVDIIRIYSIVDKGLAMDILERNRLEKEEEMLLTAQEDIDLVDVIAFMSVTPIIFELGNLMMRPMMDMIFQVFSIL